VPQRSKSSTSPTSTRGRHAAGQRYLQAQASALAHGDCGDPFSVLGLHAEKPDQFVVRCYHPAASQAWVIDRTGSQIAELEQQYEPGFFAGPVPGRIDYRLRLALPARTMDLEDPYRFPPALGDVDMHLLAEGTHLRLYERLGAQLIEMEGIKGVSFAVWAPNARRVSVVGDFNDWDGRRHPMRKRFEAGVWELFLPELNEGAIYKYEIKSADGKLLPLKADPLSFQSERPPRTASIVHGAKKHAWNDEAWMSGRRSEQPFRADLHLRMPSRLLGARAGGEQPLSDL
jgi:1,4-alpha-glucan branching enzyme